MRDLHTAVRGLHYLPLSISSRYRTVYVEDVLGRANFQREAFANDTEKASIDVTADGTKFDIVAPNTVHL